MDFQEYPKHIHFKGRDGSHEGFIVVTNPAEEAAARKKLGLPPLKRLAAQEPQPEPEGTVSGQPQSGTGQEKQQAE